MIYVDNEVDLKLFFRLMSIEKFKWFFVYDESFFCTPEALLQTINGDVYRIRTLYFAMIRMLIEF